MLILNQFQHGICRLASSCKSVKKRFKFIIYPASVAVMRAGYTSHYKLIKGTPLLASETDQTSVFSEYFGENDCVLKRFDCICLSRLVWELLSLAFEFSELQFLCFSIEKHILGKSAQLIVSYHWHCPPKHMHNEDTSVGWARCIRSWINGCNSQCVTFELVVGLISRVYFVNLPSGECRGLHWL